MKKLKRVELSPEASALLAGLFDTTEPLAYYRAKHIAIVTTETTAYIEDEEL